jgi:hypothetical protein
MEVSSTTHSSLSKIPLSLQSARPRQDSDSTVAAVGPNTEHPDHVFQSASNPEPRLNLDDGTEKKLNRIKEVQVAFHAALNIANSIESQYLLDPII